jgi:hypothetical protein
VRSSYSWPEPEREITVIATPKESVHPSVAGVATADVYRIHPSALVELAHSAVEIHRQLAGELVGLNDEEAADRMAEALKGKGLDTPELIERLSADPLR